MAVPTSESAEQTEKGEFRFHDGQWAFEIFDRADLARLLPRPVLGAFCRCLIQVDRLSSLLDLARLSQKEYPEQEVSHGRNANAIVWLAIGTFRELGIAIGGLLGAVRKAGGIADDSEPLKGLRETHNWCLRLGLLRKKAAFHLDEDLVKKGLEATLSTPGPVIVLRGPGVQMSVRSESPLAAEVLERGADEVLRSGADSLLNMSEVLESMTDKFAVVKDLINLLILCMRSRGMEIGVAQPIPTAFLAEDGPTSAIAEEGVGDETA